ncbi:MAG: helix-turn-helix transcriptional regulator [Chitinophagaceae bacterium]
MFILNLGPVFKARGISNPYSWLVKAGLPRHTAARLLYTEVHEIRLKHLSFLCKHLVCDPRDILQWVPKTGEVLADNHPLHKHNRNINSGDWAQNLATLPLEQLQVLTNALVTQAESTLPNQGD